ncbi:sigma 54-interacting transcriptional regulator [Desulfallas sp. Bu1-1]|jgi:PAS domain S-box-containing protein|uniref:sigma 54-interacting transcriptional regulator n=1 Tax=Desulfallas sp. Bu1-1 TaxID=2787620 RepID=UPI00189D0542|nr:sigma 54-interacting transcriptional regulator [Desulfallas sp. Bu1-1]MBF7081898.1 sigma 54-interacting transcriptional regulator [Desulfallas sp. Bu1-1]
MALKSNVVKTSKLETDNTIFDCIANLVIAVDHRGYITIFNHTCERLFGITAEQAIGKPVSQVIPYTGLIKVLKTGKAHIGRKFVLGNTLYIVNRTPIIKDNRIIGAIGVAQEITELHQLAAELEAVKDRKNSLESIFEHTNEGYISINREGYVNFINHAMAGLLKTTPEKVLNHHVTEIFPETKVHFFQIDGGSQQNKILKLADRNVLVSCFPVFKNGKVEGAISKVVYQDVDKLAALALKSESAWTKKNEIKSRYTLDDIIGASKAVSKLKEIVRRVARGPSTVLITGESGTGKELFAHALHAHSPRANKPFVKVNCAAIPENLLESELFGYREGAFTGSRKGGQIGKFELAHRGTIFLDEIGDMPLSMQAKVLRVLQEKEIERLGDRNTQKVDVRIIAATNRDLAGLIAEGRFRRDLYYRLNVVNINIPPLRERKEDIRDLVNHFIAKYNREFSLKISNLSRDVMELFERYNWPGNVRELENIIERAFNLVENDTIEMNHLPHYLLEFGGIQGKEQKTVNLNKSLPALLESVEKEAIVDALERTGGNKLQSAKLLGISRAWLYKKIKQYQIE